MDAKSKTFLLYVYGILYLMTPDAKTYTFDVQREQWKMSITSLIDPKTHRISKQLSTIRLSNLDILGWSGLLNLDVVIYTKYIKQIISLFVYPHFMGLYLEIHRKYLDKAKW